MNRFISHQRNPKFNLFGLFASRSLFRKAPHQTPHDEVSGKQAEVDEKLKSYQESLVSGVNDYNKHWGSHIPRENRDNLWYHYETLKIDLNNIDATEAQLKRITAALKRKYGKQFENELGKNEQFVATWELGRAIKHYKTLPKKGQEVVRGAHRGRFGRRFEQLSRTTEGREAWKKKPAFGEVETVFNAVADDKEFQHLFKSPNGMVTQNQREARELFLAMMAEKTNNFQSTFVLGDEFGNDPEENIRKFPFLYKEFLKHEGAKVTGESVSEEAIMEAQAKTRDAAAKIQGKDNAEVIIKRNEQLAGLKLSDLPPHPATPATEDWEKRVNVLQGMVYRMREKANDMKGTPNEPQMGGLIQSAADLELHVAYAKSFLALSRLKDRETRVRLKFTRSELDTEERRRTVITLAMRKFMKAQEMVDYPKGTASWKYTLHPTVRRMLIASTYDSGVARYETKSDGSVEYNDKSEGQHAWMLSTLVLSDYFNFKEKGEAMDADHAAALKGVYLGGQIAVLLEKTKELYDPDESVDGLLEAWIKVLEAGGDAIPADPAEREAYFTERMGYWPAQYVRKYAKYTLAEAQTALEQVKADRKKLQEFLEDAQAAVQHLYGEKRSEDTPEVKSAQEFIAAMRKGDYKGLAPSIERLGSLGIISGASLAKYEDQMKNLQLNFKISELQEKNMLQFFEGLGMNIEGIYPAYLSQVQKNPKLAAEYWDDMLLGTPEEFEQLVKLLNTIIPNSRAGGKTDFIAGLRSLRAKYNQEKSLLKVQASLKEGSQDFAVFTTFLMLREHVSARREKAAMSDRAAKAMDKALGGIHIGDKVSQYASGVFDMAFGPGQSVANRITGLGALYFIYKSARSAMKGDTKYGKAMRLFFGAGMLEIAMSELTGQGFLSRAGLDGVESIMGGKRYEAVLMADAKENNKMNEITPKAHAAALSELRDVPFHQVMEWYENSDDLGEPLTKGGKDYFPSQIQISKIKPRITWDAKDKQKEARRVVRETVKHFFRYVGDKQDYRGTDYAKNALKERWIIMMPGNKEYKQGYKPSFTEYDHTEWAKAGGVTSKEVTWDMVMRCEIDPSRVDTTKTESVTAKLEATATEWYEQMSKWTREHILNPGTGYSEKFFKGLGENAQDAKDFFEKVQERTKQKVWLGAQKAVLWYGEHQYEIKRVAGDHWQLLVTGVGLPFKVVYAVDNWAIPWTLAKLEQVELSLKHKHTVHIKEDLAVKDIVANPAQMGSSNLELNPQFKFYGMHQEQFLRAFEAGKRSDHMYYQDRGTNVGYYISALSPKEAGIDQNDPIFSGDMANQHHKVMAASRKAAAERFYAMGMDPKLVEKYLYSMHTIVKTTEPKTVYVFWRMPLEGSPELYMQESGNFADYRDPNKRKDREHFAYDPSQTSWENIKKAFALDTDGVRKVLASTGGYVAQVPRVVFAHWEVAGNVVGKIGRAFGGGKEFQDAVEAATKTSEGTRIFIDEAFTSGKSRHMALSEFYKDPVNAKLYAFSLAYATNRNIRLHTGLLDGRRGYEASPYLLGDLDYADMKKYYENHIKPKKADTDIERALDEKLR